MWPDSEEIYNHVYGRCQTSVLGCEFLIVGKDQMKTLQNENSLFRITVNSSSRNLHLALMDTFDSRRSQRTVSILESTAWH